MENIIVTTLGVVLVTFIYWFFFGKKEDAAFSSGLIDIVVDGGYKPSVVKIRSGQKTTLSLLRKDPSSCLEEFVLPDFKIKEYLPLGEKVNVVITPKEKGEYPFHCGMNMFHGKVVVV